MKTYTVIVEDIFDKKKSKKFTLQDINVFMVHKNSLKNVNALREEVSRIICDDKVVYTFKDGFKEE
jgi:hypothetical protein